MTDRSPGTRRVVGDTVALYGAQTAALIVPLILLPFMTRVLPREEWGSVAAAQSLALMIGVVVEFGFIYGGTRTVAMTRDTADGLGGLISAVQGIKFCVSAALLALGLAIGWLVGLSSADLGLVGLAVLLGSAQGFSTLWFFQGIEQIRTTAFVELGGKVIGATAILLLVRDAGDGWIYLACLATLTASSNAINSRRMRQMTGGRRPSNVNAMWKLFRESVPLLGLRVLTSINALGGPAILQAMVGGTATAGYANADRLSGAARSMIVPPSQVLFPKAVTASETGSEAHGAVLRRALLAFVAAFIAMMLVAQGMIAWFVPWFFGEKYTDTIGLFRVLLLTIPLVAASNVLGVLGLLAVGKVRQFNRILMTTTVVFLVLVAVLVPLEGAMGLAIANVTTEAAVVAALLVANRRLLSLRRHRPT